MNQKEKLLNLLKDGEWHSNIEVLNDLHIWRVSARIFNLREDGYQIETKNGKGSYYYYRLKQEPVQLTLGEVM